jgi:hypothetical protein
VERSAAPGNANRELALYYTARGKRAALALEIAQKESARRQDVYTMASLAVALFANRQKEEARSVMEYVLAVGTRDPRILEQAARLGVKAR